ncbi:MAG TPA: TonB family protein [Candidatus Obscuribacterales bacterium]
MQKQKDRVSLRCAEDPAARAAYQILVDPDAQEEQWIEACTALKLVHQASIEPPRDRAAQPNADIEHSLGCSIAGVPDIVAQADQKRHARKKKLRALLNNPRQRARICIALFLYAALILAGIHNMWLHLGVTDMSRGYLASADLELQASSAVWPLDSRPYSNRASVLLEEHHNRKAIEIATQALWLQPDDAKAYGLRALAYHRIGKEHAALQDVRIANQLVATSGYFWDLEGDIESSLNLPRQAIASYQQALANGYAPRMVHIKLADTLFNNNQITESITEYNSALKIFAPDVSALWGRARSYECINKFHEAKSDLMSAVRLLRHEKSSRLSAALFTNMARCSNKLGEYDDALQEACVSAALFNDPGALLERASAECKLDKPLLALEDLDRVQCPETVFFSADKMRPQSRWARTRHDLELTRAEAWARSGNSMQAEYALRNSSAATNEAFYIRSFADFSGAGKPHALNTSEYLSNLQSRIKSNWYPPPRTSTLSTQTSFKIEPNGRIIDVVISRSSGDEELDRACMQALKSASPAAALPPGTREAVVVVFNFDYN